MSIFPKRISAGDEVVVHNAFHLSHFKEGIYFPLLEIHIIDPEGNKTTILSKVIPIVKAAKEQEQTALTQNKEMRYKYSPLVVLGRYFSSDDSVEEFTKILNSIASGKHFYHTYRLPENSLPGKYLVETIHYINGEKFYSQNKEEDFFYVEQLEISYSGEKAIIRNLSAEDCPIRYMQYNKSGKPIVNSTLKVIKGNESKEYTLLHPALIQYNEDRKTIPLFHANSIIPIQNPKLAFTEKPDSVLIFLGNKSEAFELENEYKSAWNSCDGLRNREEIIALSSAQAYQEMLEEKLILEQPYQ